ncbi:MAG TPA: hypothetical protein VGM56_10810, partial [Byssovorax sp.]
EVLAGRRLFKAEHEAATLSRVLLDPIPRLSKYAPGMPPELDEVSAKALSRDLDTRYQSAAELADALERAARKSAPAGESGIASPREVAAYVQSALGQDIAAQRESVRAWLSATSEPSVDSKRQPYDRTVKLPLDREVAAAAAAAAAREAAHQREAREAREATSLTLLDPAPVSSRPPDTLVGLAPSPPVGAPRGLGGEGAPSDGQRAQPSVSPTTGRTLVGVGQRGNANPTTLLGTGPSLQRIHAEGPGHGVAIHELDGDEEGETQLMSRSDDAPIAVLPAAGSSHVFDDPPISSAPAGVRMRDGRGRTRYLAVLVGVAAVLGLFALWRFNIVSIGPAAATRAPAPADAHDGHAPSAPSAAATVAVAAPAPSTPAPPPQSADAARPEEPAPVKVGGNERQAPRPVAPRGARPRPAAPAEPAPKPAQPPPPAPDGDLANPYR